MKHLSLAFVLAALSACGSHVANANGNVPEPDIKIEQTTTVPGAAEYSSGGIPIGLRLTVTNRATIPITLQRTEVMTVGEGAWIVPSTTRSIGHVINANATDVVEFYVGANTGVSVAGSNEPVVLRLTTTFDSAQGGFRTVSIERVSGFRR